MRSTFWRLAAIPALVLVLTAMAVKETEAIVDTCDNCMYNCRMNHGEQQCREMCQESCPMFP